jgi:hypothetical protein
MPSRAELRVRGEQVLRGIVIAVLAVMLWRSLGSARDDAPASVDNRGISGNALAKWSALATPPGTIHLRLDTVPSPVQREWLSALAGAGSKVTWTGTLPPLMIDARPIAAPTGGTRVFVSAPRGSSVVLSDDIGPIDTVRSPSMGASIALGAGDNHFAARTNGSTATTNRSDSVIVRRLLVIGNAGWESKFVVAALEEEGWKVDAFIRVAPGVDVTQGSAAVIDTARYSAVIALDGAAAPYAARIASFVQTGGGVVMEADAATLEGMSALRAGNVGNAVALNTNAERAESMSLATLRLDPIVTLRADAIPLEKRGAAIAVAARRVLAGRVVQTGYQDSWRWRMTGGDAGLRDHRQWWSELVSSVAYAPSVAVATTSPEGALQSNRADQAPLAGLVEALGSANPAGNAPERGATGSTWLMLLFAVLAFTLVGEIASRRMRGAA